MKKPEGMSPVRGWRFHKISLEPDRPNPGPWKKMFQRQQEIARIPKTKSLFEKYTEENLPRTR